MAEKSNPEPTWNAFPEDGFIALEIPPALIPRGVPKGAGYLIRVKSPEGFRNFLVAAMEAARLTWPEINADYVFANAEPEPGRKPS